MSIENELHQRSDSSCELCRATTGLQIYEVPPSQDRGADAYALLCSDCLNQIENPDTINPHHWHCLNESMWSTVPAVQVLAWRILDQLKANESWAQDLQDMLYLEEDVSIWAQALSGASSAIVHKDSNGTILKAGDSVVLIKDLNVKGAGFTAKRGTAVRRITLDPENATYIEGKVNGQHIVILTQYVKKSK